MIMKVDSYYKSSTDQRQKNYFIEILKNILVKKTGMSCFECISYGISKVVC